MCWTCGDVARIVSMPLCQTKDQALKRADVAIDKVHGKHMLSTPPYALTVHRQRCRKRCCRTDQADPPHPATLATPIGQLGDGKHKLTTQVDRSRTAIHNIGHCRPLSRSQHKRPTRYKGSLSHLPSTMRTLGLSYQPSSRMRASTFGCASIMVWVLHNPNNRVSTPQCTRNQGMLPTSTPTQHARTLAHAVEWPSR